MTEFEKDQAHELKCPLCAKDLLFIYGGGWDYDRAVCSNTKKCNFEKEYITSTEAEKLEIILAREQKKLKIIDKAVEKLDYLQKQNVFISKEEKECDDFMEWLGEHKRGDISFSITPKIKKDEDGTKVDGVMLSFKVVI